MLSAFENNSAMRWLGKQLFNREDPAAFFDPILSIINPMMVRGLTPARVEAITHAARDTRTFHLKPSARWSGFRAGQHININVEVDGVRCHRTFSLSSAPAQWQQDGTITLTIKRLPGGKVTNWLHDRLETGTVVGISEAFGEFDTPKTEQPLLYLAGGSGVTPVLSHLVTLADQNYRAPVTLLYYVRTQADEIGAETLRALEERWPALTLIIHRTDEDGPSALLGEAHLEQVPGIKARHCFLCGPPGLMDRAQDLLGHFGMRDEQISATFFTAPKPVQVTGPLGGEVRFAGSDVTVESEGDAPLLEIAEAAKLNPKHGCRMGICHQCSCRKTSGTVVNRLTGKASGPGEETIQLCISVPQGDVEVDA